MERMRPREDGKGETQVDNNINQRKKQKYH